MTRSLLPIFVSLLLAGCFTYTPLESGAAPSAPEADIRVTVTEDGAELLSGVTGREARRLEGSFRGWEEDHLNFSVVIRNPAVGGSQRQRAQVVRIPRDDVILVENRELDTRQTVIVGAGTAVVLGAAVWRATGQTASGENGVPNGGPSVIRIPLSLP